MTNAYAQTGMKGKVLDENGIPLPGVSILIKGTSTGSVTDFDGEFAIEARSGDNLEFSFLGYKKQTIKLVNQNFLNVRLEADTESLEEVVVVGYGTQKKKEVTGAVGIVNSDIIAKAPVADLGESIQGQVAGVNVQSSSGRPGEAANIQIRGLGSVSSGALGPLYVVDGIPFQGNPNIPTEQIEKIDILKDGAAAAVYGTRASNGVILITTKKGKAGTFNVNFSTYGGVQNITSGTPLMNTQQQMYAEEVKLEALGRDPLIFFFNPDALDYDSDFVGDVQNNNAGIQNYDLGISGGSENLTLNLSANYFNQDGILINSGFDRLSTRLNGEFKKGKFRAFASLAFTQENRQQEPWALYEYAIAQNPWQPALNQIQSNGENSVQIPVRNSIQYSYLSRELENEDDREVNTTNVAINLEYEFLDGLSYQLNLGRNTYDYARKFFRPQYLVYDYQGDFNPTASRVDAQLDEDFVFSERRIIENLFKYNKSFGNHNFNLLGVLSYEEFSSKTLSTGVIGLLSNDTPVLGAGTESLKPSSYDSVNTLSGKLFRVQYNYDERYLFSASYRRDGSSNFGEDFRYGDFLGFSAGWNISEEAFFNVDAINSLKLRGSWAEVGNQSIPAYSFSSQIESGMNYPFGPNEEINVGAIQRRYADPNIKWETSISKNIGIDLGMFRNRLNFTADFYQTDKEDMLIQERLPASSGTYHTRALGTYDVRVTNGGNMTNKGVELGLSFKGKIGQDLNYSLAGTFTKNVNEVTNLNGVERGYANGRPVVSLGDNVDYTTFLAEGYEAGAFFLVQHDGIIKTQAELDEYKLIEPSAALGDMMYIDENNDGKIDDSDRVYAGSGQADYEAGLSLNLDYKGFDFYVQSYYSHGAEIYNGARLYAYTQGRHEEQYYMWSPQNSNSGVPTFRENAFDNSIRARSDYFLEDGTYLRIRNISLGYTIPMVDTSILKKTRIYFTAMNPFTFTDYNGYDPEVGGDGIFTRGVDRGNYPVSRRFIVGVQLNF
ncbi:TonB-dependent receptor [Tamlana sp. 2_MG-2023]|uniref:SusC/RagA family TonB-linked outer membrane protein n=1 Tax=unclassified Tamlana TaxID=2614803 RepID=UPI0026E2727C|nr:MULTISPECIES: TonB-dependent receptor [unclassified Tamlana]MDO6761322.1 TonB-dependent receptor [Tamlana sp. 2_MG-2023]MDO6791805.1 TonB-dependent receptor [Tamlana sp. 1_MG-2023]